MRIEKVVNVYFDFLRDKYAETLICISAKKHLHSLLTGKSGVLEELIHAESRKSESFFFCVG